MKTALKCQSEHYSVGLPGIAIVVVLLMVLLAACTPVQRPSPTAHGVLHTDAGTAGTVHWIDNGDPEEPALIKGLQQVQPGIAVTLEQDSHAGNDFNLDVPPLPSMVTVGTGLDYGKTLDKHGAADLSAIWEQSGLAAAMPPSLQRLTARDGKQFYVPAAFGWEAIYYNKQIFAQYNLQPPQNWEEFLAVNDALRSHGETPLVIAAEGDSRGYWFQYLVLRLYGAQVYHDLLNGHIPFNDPRIRNVMEKWQALFERGDLKALAQGNDQDMMMTLVRGDTDKAAAASGSTRAVMALTDGHVASQLTPDLLAELGFFRFPIMDPSLPVTEATYSYGYAAPTGQPLSPATEALLNFAGSAAGQAIIAHAHNDWTSGRADIAAREDAAQQEAAELLQQADAAVQDFYGLMPGQMISMFDDTLTGFINAPQEIDGPLNELETARQIMLDKGAFADSTIESSASPTQTASTLVGQLLLAGPDDASSPVSDALVFQVDAADPAVAGTFPGHQEVDGIDHVDFDLFGPDGQQLYHHLERWAPYCGFDDGDPCNIYNFAEHNYQWPKGQAIVNGPLRLLATVYARDGRVKTVDTTVMVENVKG